MTHPTDSPGRATASAVARPLRADAQRNRDRLLEVAVRALSADGPDVTLEATGAITTLLDAAGAAGTLRPDIEPADVLASLSGVSIAAGEPTQRDQAGRLLDLLMDGLRYRAAAPR